MKTIGIFGGLTWLSSLDYYRIINETVNQKLGGDQAAKVILYSLKFRGNQGADRAGKLEPDS